MPDIELGAEIKVTVDQKSIDAAIAEIEKRMSEGMVAPIRPEVVTPGGSPGGGGGGGGGGGVTPGGVPRVVTPRMPTSPGGGGGGGQSEDGHDEGSHRVPRVRPGGGGVGPGDEPVRPNRRPSRPDGPPPTPRKPGPATVRPVAAASGVAIAAGAVVGVAAVAAGVGMALNKWSDGRLKSLIENAQTLSGGAAGIKIQQDLAKMSRDYRRFESVSERAQALSRATIQRDEAMLPLLMKVDDIAVTLQTFIVERTTQLVELVTKILEFLGLELNKPDEGMIDLLASLNSLLGRPAFDTGIRTPFQPFPNLMRPTT